MRKKFTCPSVCRPAQWDWTCCQVVGSTFMTRSRSRGPNRSVVVRLQNGSLPEAKRTSLPQFVGSDFVEGEIMQYRLGDHSPLMPAARMILAHFSVYPITYFLNSVGGYVSTVSPSSANRAI